MTIDFKTWYDKLGQQAITDYEDKYGLILDDDELNEVVSEAYEEYKDSKLFGDNND